MKKFIAIATLAGVISLSAGAQTMPERKNDGVNKERTEKRGDVYKDLNLTKDQQQKIKALNQDSHAQAEAIRNDNTISQEQKREKFNTLKESQKVKRDAILTDEQRTKIEAKKKDMHNNRKDGRDAPSDQNKMKNDADHKKHGNWEINNGTNRDQSSFNNMNRQRRGNDQMKDLNLTKDQKIKMKALNEETHTKMQSIRGNASLTSEQKKARVQELMKDVQAQRRAILTPEQLSKWEMSDKQIRADRPRKRGNTQNKI